MSQPGDNSSTTWFVTGASRGFGRELAEQLLARGDRVAATVRRTWPARRPGRAHTGTGYGCAPST